MAMTCPFCKKTSAPVAKPAEPVRVVVEHVARSGTAANSLSCPRCNGTLFEGKAEGVTMLGCGVCGGIWLDNDGSMEITRNAHPEVMALADRARDHAVTRVDTGPTSVATCPVCKTAMRRTRVINVADVDVCAAHGTWFDAGELELIARALIATMQKQRADQMTKHLEALAEATRQPDGRVSARRRAVRDDRARRDRGRRRCGSPSPPPLTRESDEATT
jgi:Zn-finger nucleic acid-binding protein